jgi:hypothetical protein
VANARSAFAQFHRIVLGVCFVVGHLKRIVRVVRLKTNGTGAETFPLLIRRQAGTQDFFNGSKFGHYPGSVHLALAIAMEIGNMFRMSIRPGTVERAFQLARESELLTVEKIRVRLKAEGYSDWDFQLSGKSIRDQLRAIVVAKRVALKGAST